MSTIATDGSAGLPDHIDVPTMVELFVDHRTLPMPPVAVLEIMRRSDDPDVAMSEIVTLVESEVSIAVQVLRMANSALYSPAREITTISRAMTTLGLRTIRFLALTTSLRALMPQTSGVMEMAEVRRRMVMNGGLARALSTNVDPAVRDEAFLVGLLTGIGPVVLASRAPELCSFLTAPDGMWPKPAREQEVLGYTSDDVTASLVDEWGLPPVFGDVIRGRTAPIDTADSSLAVCVKAALLAEAVLTRREAGEGLAALRKGLHEAADLSTESVDRWLIEAEPVVAEAADLMQFRIVPDDSYEELLIEATDRMQVLQASMEGQLFKGFEDADELAKRNDELEVEAATDALTGLPNRRALDDRLRALLGSASQRLPVPRSEPGSSSEGGVRGLGILMLDLDRFKTINDRHGHGVGDDVLQRVGGVLQQQTRGADFAARLGGEEFVMLIPDTTRDHLFAIAERLRLAVASLAISLDDGGSLTLTTSVGGVLIDDRFMSLPARDLLDLADHELYGAKQRGRNCTSMS